MLKRFTLNNNAEKIAFLKKKYEDVIGLLLQLKREKEPYNMPEGFKFLTKTSVKYNSRLAPHFLDILGEGKYVCYQVLEDILFNIFNSSIIEPYVEVFTEETVEIEPEKLRNWSPGITIAYILLDKKYKFHGMFAADALEDGLRRIFKRKIKDDYIEPSKNELKKEKKSNFKMTWVQEGIKKKMELYKQSKMEEKRKKMEKKYEEILKLSKEEKLKLRKKFEEVQKRRNKLEEEKYNKLMLMQKEKKKKEEEKNKARVIFFNSQFNKLTEQFKKMIANREQMPKVQEEKIKKEKSFFISDKDRDYYTFEKNLNSTIKELMGKDEIKSVFGKYNNHLKLIYEIYSKIGYNKISFYSKEAISLDEFKQFCINFTILGVLISSEQMIWIFKNIAKILQNERNGQMYFDFDDFKMSICYLAIISNIDNKDRKILPKDIEETSGDNIEKFMKYLEFKIPYNRIEMENFINERRSMTIKNMLTIQHQIKIMDLNKKNKGNDSKENKENQQEKNKMGKEIVEEAKNNEINSEINDDNNNENKSNNNNSDDASSAIKKSEGNNTDAVA